MSCRLANRLALVATVVFFVLPAAAFDWKEHQALGELGLRLALERYGPRLDPEVTRAIFAQLLNCDATTVGTETGTGDCIPFASLVAIPDAKNHVEQLLLARDVCIDSDSGTDQPEARCRPLSPTTCDLEAMAHSESLTSDDPACFHETAELIRKREKSIIKKLLAFHTNVDHFERCAANRYNQFHDLARRQAGARRGANPSRLIAPLVTEGIALHFLQDSFPPGHLLTPRAYTPDLVARGLHDRHNNRATPGYAEPDAEMSELLSILRTTTDTRTAKLRDELYVTPVGAFAFPAVAQQGRIDFLGDGALRHKRGKRKAEPNEAILLVLLTARSVGEVLEASTMKQDSSQPTDGSMRIEFHDWSAHERSGQANEQEKLFDPHELFRPSFNVLTPQHGAAGATDVAGYFAAQPAQDADRVYMFRPEFTFAALRSTGSAQTGVRSEMAIPLAGPGTGDVVDIDAPRADKTPNYFRTRIRQGLAGLLNLEYEGWGHTKAYGGSGLILFFDRDKARVPRDSYIGVGFGAKRYDSGTLRSNRGILCLRGGIGVGVVFLDLGLERDHRFETDDRLECAWTASLGLRVQIPY